MYLARVSSHFVVCTRYFTDHANPRPRDRQRGREQTKKHPHGARRDVTLSALASLPMPLPAAAGKLTSFSRNESSYWRVASRQKRPIHDGHSCRFLDRRISFLVPPSSPCTYLSLTTAAKCEHDSPATPSMDGWISRSAMPPRVALQKTMRRPRKEGREEGRTRRTEETRTKNTKYSAQRREEKAARSARECGRMRQMLKWIVWYEALE